jgi:hypothetical protein
MRTQVMAVVMAAFLFAAASVIGLAAAQSTAVHVLWGIIAVRVPSGSHEEFQPQNLGFGVYRFRDPAKREHSITIQYDFLDAPGFLTPGEIARSRAVALNGLNARRYVANGTVSLQVKLPKPAECGVKQFYAFVTYRAGDRWSERVARTVSIVKPYRCPTAVP